MRKNQFKLKGFLMLFSIAFLFSCTKNDFQSNEKDNLNLSSKANAWLDSKLSKNAERNARVELIRKNLDFASVFVEDLTGGEKLLVIPINKTDFSSYNKNKQATNALVLTMKNDGNIRKGNLVQYIGESVSKKEISNSIAGIIDDTEVKTDGQFVFLSIFDRYLFDVVYAGNQRKSFSDVNRKNTSAQSRTETGCIDWYLVTIYYDADGFETGRGEQYLATTCEGDCLPGEMCDHLDGGGSGGGVNEVDYIYSVQKPVNWTVAEPQSHFWFVQSFETIGGEKVAGEPWGGHFTSHVHNSSSIFNMSQGNHASWEQLQVSNTYTEAIATATISGKVTFDDGSPDQPVLNKQKVWTFYQEFQ